jgi:PrcB C-terminal
MLRAVLVTLLLLLAGCSAGDGSEEPRDLRVERISSDAPGQGPRQPRAVVAPSAAALSGEIGANVPDSGSGTYLAAYWGEKPTGGYSMSVRSARLEGSRVIVRLALKEPPRDAILTQSLTYPYAVAVIRELDPGGKDFSFVDENGRELGWPVRRV